MNDRVLLTGASGFLGRYLVEELGRRRATVLTAGREGCDVSLDLAAPEQFAHALADVAPGLVLHCGAMSSMGACQAHPVEALKVNGKAPRALAAASGVRFVQVSTDLVFGGDAAPYHHASPLAPLSVYGMSKAEGEKFADGDWLVVRLPLLFGRSFDGERGATDMLRRGVGRKEPLVLYSNEFRTPLHAADAAQGVVEFALDRGAHGIRHVAGAERVSRWELGERFCRAVGIGLDAFRPGVSEDPRRPKDVSLVADWSPDRDLDAGLAVS